MKIENLTAGILLIAFAVSACTKTDPPSSVTIMTFNVQNVFDNIDAPGKDDKAYLPIGDKQTEAHIAECNTIPVESWRDECLNLDWSDEAIDHKLAVISATIQQVNDGRGPDIIALQEIENVDILERLRTGYLADSNYLPAVLLEGTDIRGIDVAFLTRLPISAAPTLHALNLPANFADRAGDTRGLLQATFELPDGSLLTGFSVHFPAPFHPTEMRVFAYEHLNAVRGQVPPEHNIFAAGDFNTTSIENDREGMLERFIRPDWAISNDYCERCPGTQYYSRDESWSFLDMVVFAPSDNADSAWQVRSVEIANQLPAQITENGTPNRYRSAERIGVSDHWPVLMTLERRP
jgi:endonuclease/exonuclease/phosphatase family metal-dependent hydrolase